MVNVVNYDNSELNNVLASKRIHCIGAGKKLELFLQEHSGVIPFSIFDNYAEGYRNVNGKCLQIQKVDSLKTIHLEKIKDLIVVTTIHYADLLNQLDAMQECNDIDCLFPYIPNGEIQRKNEIIDSLKVEEAGARFQLLFDYSHNSETFVSAGDKAPDDIARIAGKKGYTAISVKAYWGTFKNDDWRVKARKLSWEKMMDQVISGAILLLQNPNWNEHEFELRKENIRRLKNEKNIRIISIVHDVEELRKIDFNSYMQQEAEFMMETSDILIVHNRRMIEFYLGKGVKEDRLVNLQIFDYLCANSEIPIRTLSKDVIIAGNLSYAKNPHLAGLCRLKNTYFRLFGVGYNEDNESTNVIYEGALDSNELPNKLPDGFGLVWGGDSLESCTGKAGEYLRYNDPHKLSLYLAAGLPVIIWDEAAMADFVIENDVGFTVSSLYQLESKLSDVTEEVFDRYASNARKIGERLRAGEYTKAAIKEAEKRLRLKD